MSGSVCLTLFSLPCLSSWYKHAVELGVCLPHSQFTAILVFLGKHAVELGVCLALSASLNRSGVLRMQKLSTPLVGAKGYQRFPLFKP